MEQESSTVFHQSSSSAAAPKNIYSAKELADIYMKCRSEFLDMDMEEVTRGWNSNFIFDLFVYLEEKKLIELAAEWIKAAWEDKHHMLDSYDNLKDAQLTTQAVEFALRLKDIQKMALGKIEAKRKKEALIEKMLQSNVSTKLETITQPPIVSKAIETIPPQFNQQSMSANQEDIAYYRVLLTDLPKELSDIVVVSQEVFDMYVYQLNTDTWTLVEKNKGIYCDALRFLSNFYNITSRNTTREQYDLLLHKILKGKEEEGSYLSSMGRRKDTNGNNIKRSYQCYNSPLDNHKKERWQLIHDCQPLVESLQPVLNKMNEKSQTRF